MSYQSGSPQDQKLLIVDDDPIILDTMIDYLQPHYQLSIAKNKDRALKLLENENYALVLLDINLPDGNGIDICREIRSRHEFSDLLSIICMTSDRSSDLEAQGFVVGANDYITKPINKAVLLARVKHQLNVQRQTLLLSRLAQIDGLTEIGNRRAFDEQIEGEWYRAKRSEKPLSLALIDIDYFKQYNDTYGHPAGDSCLKKLAKCLLSVNQRSSDFCFRYGGEEFAVILYDTSIDSAKNQITRALERFRELNIPHKSSPIAEYVTFSAGIATTVPSRNHSDTFLKQADQILYLAKEGGRNQVIASMTKDIPE